MSARPFPTSLAEEWRQWERTVGAEFPELVRDEFLRPLFYAGALAAGAMLANGISGEELYTELAAFARECGYDRMAPMGHA